MLVGESDRGETDLGRQKYSDHRELHARLAAPESSVLVQQRGTAEYPKIQRLQRDGHRASLDALCLVLHPVEDSLVRP